MLANGLKLNAIESIQPIENFIHPYVTEYLENENFNVLDFIAMPDFNVLQNIS